MIANDRRLRSVAGMLSLSVVYDRNLISAQVSDIFTFEFITLLPLSKAVINDYELPRRTSHIADSNFIIRMLYKI